MSASRLFRFILLVSTCAIAQSSKPVGELLSSDASVQGAVTLTSTGASVQSGASVAAGQTASRLRLARGGEVRICPRTTLSVTTSPNGRDLMLSMGSGGLETQYALPASADTVMTPDFRILLPGPGNFHFAVGSDNRGNTCIRTLSYNTASLIVSELMGDATYQVKPNEEVLFRGGKIANRVAEAGVCGCSAPPVPTQRAEAIPLPTRVAAVAPWDVPNQPTNAAAPATAPVPPPASPPTVATAVPPAPPNVQGLATAARPPVNPQELHVEVEAPFVYRATDPPPELDVTAYLATLRGTTRRTLPIFTPVVLPPPAQQVATAPTAVAPLAKPRAKGFFGKMRSFFGKIFH